MLFLDQSADKNEALEVSMDDDLSDKTMKSLIQNWW